MKQNLRVYELDNVLREVTLFCELARQLACLGLGRDFACEQKPEHALSDDLLAAGCSRQLFLTVWNGEAMEADALRRIGHKTALKINICVKWYLIGVEDRGIPEH
jgi:hypothetical protein